MAEPISRRTLLKLGGFSALWAGAAAVLQACTFRPTLQVPTLTGQAGGHNHGIGLVPGAGVGSAAPPPAENGLNMMEYLSRFDHGTTTTDSAGRTVREWTIEALDAEIEVADGVKFPAWTFNGQVPGPTLRCTEGDRLKVHFVNNGSHAHSMHFHGIHPAGMDGFQAIPPGSRFTYEFDAEPFGMHLYHCHVPPLRKHIHKGLYGVFIIDPKTPRPKVDHELVMVMNAFDTDGDGENEFYSVNTHAFYYQKYPIPAKVGETHRVYLGNFTEFDLINSMHLHANMFHYYPTGTSLQPAEFTDTVVLGQGQRGILEFTFKFPGLYMFHAHQSEFAELGWMGFFKVTE